MCGLAVLFVSFLLYEKAFSTYSDQRQTGELNVQIDLKNLQVIALMKGKEEYVDYDYAYDYSDITIKPQNGTKKPLNVTETSTQPMKDNTTSTTVTSVPELITTLSNSYNSSNKENDTSTSYDIKTTTVFSVTTSQSNNFSASVDATSSADSLNVTALPTENCKKGFHRNSNGPCELIIQNPSNTLLKMLRQKSRPGNVLRRT